jgi:hypothetical protein
MRGHIHARSKRRIGPRTVTGKKSFAGKAHDHASTWLTLVRQQGLDDEKAVDLMVGMVRCLMRTY